MSRFFNYVRAHKTFFLAVGFLAIFSFTVSYATPPSSAYTPGQTLDPSCMPGTANCTVTVGGGGSSPWDAVTGGINYAGGKVGIGIATPSAALDIEGGGTVLAVGTVGAGIAVPDLGAGTRLMWYPRKAAFRAGGVSSTQWDSAQVGDYSSAFGYNTTASGGFSFATGNGSIASGTYSNAFGNATASATLSTAFGSGTASGSNSFADGLGAVASGSSSFAFGTNAQASGLESISMGFNNNAGTDYGIAIGNDNAITTTEGDGWNVAIGDSNVIIDGNDSFAFGEYNQNTGSNSFTFGDSNHVSSSEGMALGQGNTVTGIQSYAIGSGNIASAIDTFAFGIANTASAYDAFAFGNQTTASGQYSFSFGFKTIAASMTDTVFGQYNVGGGDPANWIGTDPLFEIGNSTSSSLRTNAITVLKNGKTGIALGAGAPSYSLQVGSAATSGVVARFQNSAGTCDINPTSSSLTCSSDMNLKQHIINLSDNSPWNFNTNITADNQSVLSRILALNPVAYNWKTEADGTVRHDGFIAQEVRQVFPDLVSQDPTTNLLSLNYTGLIPYTVEAIKEMNLKIDTLGVFAPQTLGQHVSDAIAYIAHLAVGTLKVGTADKPTGITLYDKVTGNPYCLSVANGQSQTTTGECTADAPQNANAGTAAPADTQSPEVQSPEVAPVQVQTPETATPEVAAPEIPAE